MLKAFVMWNQACRLLLPVKKKVIYTLRLQVKNPACQTFIRFVYAVEV